VQVANLPDLAHDQVIYYVNTLLGVLVRRIRPTGRSATGRKTGPTPAVALPRGPVGAAYFLAAIWSIVANDYARLVARKEER